MYDQFRKSIEYQRNVVRALFNSSAIDLKEYDNISNGLSQLQADLDKIEQQKKQTLGYKIKRFFKRKK